MSFRCPECKRGTNLWEGVFLRGWQGIDENLRPTGERDVSWDDVEFDGLVGCGECAWEGSREKLEVLGNDGQPLPFIHPNQLRIE